MTITCTLDEIRIYQKACEKHMEVMIATKMCEYLKKNFTDEAIFSGGMKSWIAEELRRNEDYLKSVPMPKLLPENI